MKKILGFPLILAACTAPLEDGRIVEEDEFRRTIVGRKIVLADNAFVRINSDNTISGVIEGLEATGSWDFEDGFWCRTITVADEFTEDCQLWVVEGDRLIISRNRGEGESYAWRVRD